MADDPKIEKGKVLIYRAFDVGDEINLNLAKKELLRTETSRLNLGMKVKRTIIIKQSPVIVNLEKSRLNFMNEEISAGVSAKIWDYGVISVTIALDLTGKRWSEAIKISQAVEDSDEVDDLSLKIKDDLKAGVIKAIKSPSDWHIFEDYNTFLIEKIEGVNSPEELLEKADVPALIMSESEEKLSARSKKQALKNILQYSEDDMTVIDWNSALSFEPTGEMDVANVIEFSLTHLLELRYYEEGITEKLDNLYENISRKTNLLTGLFRSRYGQMAKEAGHKYIEFSEYLGKVENSLKTVGDPYLAQIFRAAFEEFRFEDWQRSISKKMETLSNISDMLQNEINSIRNNWLEIIIILLIALEIIRLS